MPLLELNKVRKSFAAPEGGQQVVLDIAAFSLKSETEVALCGQSGSGKTTFLHLIAGILRPDEGRILVGGVEISALPEADCDRLRARTIGYIFQSFNLLPAFTCLENVLLGMSFGPGADPNFARSMLDRVGLSNRLHYRPRQLSSGQQQRVAVARALANRPKLVLADEPTGNLDHANGQSALRLIRETCRENGAALLLVSHDRQILGEFETVLDLAKINRAAQRVSDSQ